MNRASAIILYVDMTRTFSSTLPDFWTQEQRGRRKSRLRGWPTIYTAKPCWIADAPSARRRILHGTLEYKTSSCPHRLLITVASNILFLGSLLSIKNYEQLAMSFLFAHPGHSILWALPTANTSVIARSISKPGVDACRGGAHHELP